MISKSLIQFSVEGQGCVPSLSFDLRPNYGEGNEDNGDLLQKVPCRHCYTQCPQPCCRPPPTTPLLATTGHSWASLGQSLVGSWYTQGSACALQESVSPVLCKFWWLYGELMVTSSKRAYAIPRFTALRVPALATVHRLLIPPQETPKYSSVSVSGRSLGPGTHKVCLSPLSISGNMGFDSKWDFALLLSCWGFSFALERGISPQSYASAMQPLLWCHTAELLIDKFRLELKKVGKTTTTFRYDLNQIP